ncbi:MAG: hypothetical protein KDG50_11205 [Chromatiales bacterium]|nr:hypothetical protein [Chromatiales bacterium]
MKRLVALLSLPFASAAFAGHLDMIDFHNVPALTEVGLFGLSISAGLAGAWAIRRFRNRR